MADKFNCNSCGILTDTGYFYCEKCHRVHKEKFDKKEESKAADVSEKEVLNQIREYEPKQV